MKYGVSAFDIAERTEIIVENTGEAFRYDPLVWQRMEKMNLDPALPILPIMKKMFQPALFLSNTTERPEEEQRPRRLKGFTFAITGTLSQKRKQAVAYILANGGDYLQAYLCSVKIKQTVFNLLRPRRPDSRKRYENYFQRIRQ